MNQVTHNKFSHATERHALGRHTQRGALPKWGTMPNVQHAHHRDATPNRASRPRRCSAPRNRIINRKIILKYPCQRELCQEHPPKNAMPKNSYITVPCPAKWRAALPHCHATLPRAPCPAQPSPTQPNPAQPSPRMCCITRERAALPTEKSA